MHPGLLSPRRERPRSRGAALLLTVLVVLAAATITAVLVQVAVTSAAAQKRRLSHDSAVSLAAAVERRVANALSQDPLRVFTEVLADEVPRVCSGDLDTYPDAFSAGSEWPASCGATWSYPGTGNLPSGAQVFPPSPLSPVWRVEVFAEVGSERVGYVREFLPGGRDRPMLYAGGALDAGVLASSLTVSGPVYALGAVDLSSASVSDGVLVASEVSVAGAAGGLLAGPSGSDDGGAVVRDVFAAPAPSSTLRSSSGELARVGCLDVSPANVDVFSTGLCLRAGRSLVTSGGISVTFPAAGSYEAVLLVPVAAGQVRVYTRPDAPAEWPGPLAEWTEVGSFLLPASGLVVTDASTVLGHCYESAGVCHDWDGDGSPGSLVDDSFTVVAGTPSDPVDFRFGGPIAAGSGRVGVVVSGLVRVPTGASPAGSGLAIDAWLAVLGRPGEVSFASEGGSSRPSVVFEGALLLADFSVDLSGFAVSSVSVPARSDAAPPMFPSPGLLVSSDAARRTSAADLDALFLAGEASGFSAPSAPGLLAASPGDVSVVLSWSAPLGDGGVTLLDYLVEYREAGASTWSAYTDPVSVDLSASVSGLVNGTAYEFRVAAVNGVGRGPFSGTLSATPFLAPSAPIGLAVSVVSGSVTSLSLSWDAVTNVTPTGYHVYRLNPVSGLYELVASPSSNSYVDVGLAPGVAYSYKVSAFTLSGEGPLSAVASQTVPAPSPLPPTITSVTRGNLSVTVAFSSVSSVDRPVEGFKFFRDGVLVATSSDSTLVSYSFGGLVSGTSYVFGVAAFNSSGDSATVTETATSVSTPNAVSSLTVVPEEGVPQSLVLSWSPPSNVTSEGFYVYRENVLSGIFEVVATVSDSSYVDSGLDVGELYSYRVSAFVSTLEGGLSATVSETAIEVPFDAVVLGSSVGDLEVTLDFVVDSSPGRPLDGYRVFQDGVEVAAVDSGSGSYVFTGLVDGFTYEFGVLGYNLAGEGLADSVLVTAYALPSEVTGLTVERVTGSGSSLALAWDEPAGSYDGFYLYRLNDVTGLYEVVSTVALTSYQDSALVAGNLYSYKVAAFNAVDTGPLSSAVSATPDTAPGAPSITTITPSSAQFSVAFTAGSNSGTAITTYQYSTDDGTSWRTRASGTTASPLVITTISGAANTNLVNGVAYQVRLRAVNGAGSGTQSASVTATPDTAPGAPSITTITPSSAQLSVAFTTGSNSGTAITTYQYSTDDGTSWRTRASGTTASPLVITTISGAANTNLVNGVAYQVRLRAVNGAGSGTQSASVTATATWCSDYATGGTVSQVTQGSTTYCVHQFTSVGSSSFTVTRPGGLTDVEYLVIGGGGSGGAGNGGGGGAGGYRSSVTGESSGAGSSAESRLTLPAGSYAVAVGSGGTAKTWSGPGTGGQGNDGGSSSFSTITAAGGGGGGNFGNSGTNPGRSGGSGGGGGGADNANPTGTGGSGTASQGRAGGTGSVLDSSNTGGGGGGANNAGEAAPTSRGGVGGNGISSSITGASTTRAGGGGGGARLNKVGGSGGSGGGGAGGGTAATDGSNGSPGTANTGSGGGGAGNANTSGAGGSGIVVVRYAL